MKNGDTQFQRVGTCRGPAGRHHKAPRKRPAHKSGSQEDRGKAELCGQLLQRSLVMGLIGVFVVENRRPVKLQASKMREKPCRVLKQ